MALVDVKDHDYNRKITTGYHKYYFGRTEKPKVLDLFNTNVGNMKFLWGTGISIEVGGQKVHRGFMIALQDFIMNDQILVKLTKEEEDFFKKNFPSVYKKYKENHKGQKFHHEIEEEKKKKLKKEEE